MAAISNMALVSLIDVLATFFLILFELFQSVESGILLNGAVATLSLSAQSCFRLMELFILFVINC